MRRSLLLEKQDRLMKIILDWWMSPGDPFEKQTHIKQAEEDLENVFDALWELDNKQEDDIKNILEAFYETGTN